MTISDVYNAKILEFAGNIPRIGRLDDPDGTSKAHSKLCGSTVIVDVKVTDGRVSDYAHDVKACALGQASASIVAANAVGCSLAELENLRLEMTAMLKDGGVAPAGKFGDLKYLEPVREHKARHASTLLAFDAVVKATQQALGEANGKGREVA